MSKDEIEVKKQLEELEQEELTPELAAKVQEWQEDIDELVQAASFQEDIYAKKIVEKLTEQIKAIKIILMEGKLPLDEEGKKLATINDHDRARLQDRIFIYRWMLKWFMGAEEELKAYKKTIEDAIAEDEKYN